jgi:hypothetical protein
MGNSTAKKNCKMRETLGIGPLERRRGVAPETLFIWIIVAAVGGAIAWGFYGNDVRSILNLPPAGAPAHWVTNQKSNTTSDAIVDLVKELQAAQQRTADDVRTALQLLTSEQATAKALSDAVAALQAKVDAVQGKVDAVQAKVDAIQRPPVQVAKKPAPSAPRKPSAPPSPSPTSPEPEQSEPEPGAPTSIVVPEGR